MRFRYTALAIILLGLLGAGAYYTNLEEAKKQIPVEPLFPFVKEDLPKVNKVIIWGKSSESVCEKLGPLGWWYLANSEIGRVDTRKIAAIFYELAELKQDAIIARDVEDLKQFGLEEIKVAAEYWLEGKPYKIILGKPEIKRERYYARLAGSRDVFLVKRKLFNLMNKGKIELADQRILGVGSYEIDSVELTGKGQEYQFAIAGQQFRLLKPVKKVLRPELVADVLRNIVDLRTISIGSDIVKPEDTDIDEPEITMKLVVRGNQVRLDFVKKNEKVYFAKRDTDNQIMQVRTKVIDNLFDAFADLAKEDQPKDKEGGRESGK